MPALCPSCHQSVAEIATNRLPPWCPHCGGDLKRTTVAPALQPAASVQEGAAAAEIERPARSDTRFQLPLTWREPAAPACSGEAALEEAYAGTNDPLEAALRRIKQEQHEQEQKRRSNRWTGLGAMVAGLLIVALIVALNTFLAGEGRIVIPVQLTLLGFILAGVGGYTFFSGCDVLNLAGKELYVIRIGPDGVSRTLGADVGPSALSAGWSHAWDDIDTLAYVEDPILGSRSRVLEVHTHAGQIERLRIAENVSREQLASALTLWGKRLEVRAQ